MRVLCIAPLRPVSAYARLPLLALWVVAGLTACRSETDAAAVPSRGEARSAEASHQPATELPRRVAHALGGIDGRTYVNAPEAFLANYARGCRSFEIDLWLLKSGDVVAIHGAGERQRPGLGRRFTLEQYLEVKPYGTYSPLTLEGVAELSAAHPDAIFITDMRGDEDTKREVPLDRHLRVMRKGHKALCEALEKQGVDCPERVVPQAYTFEDVLLLEQLGFPRIVLTLYRIPEVSDDMVAAFAAKNPSVVAVTVSHQRMAKMKREVKKQFAKADVPLYVHTVNGGKVDQAFADGATGVYTDFDCVSD